MDLHVSGAGTPALVSRDYLGVIGRHRWLVVLVVGWAVGLAALYSFTRPPVYTAEAAVLVRPAVTSVDTVPVDVNPDTESQVVSSTAVATIASHRLEGQPSITGLLRNLTVDVPENTEILRILYSAADPQQAQQGADAFATAYLDFRRQQAQARAADTVSTLEAELEETVIPELKTQRQRLEDPDLSDEQEAAIRDRLRDLTAQRRVLENQILIASAVTIDPGEIIATPLVPTSPSSPNHTLDLALGAIIGLGLAFGLAYVRDRGEHGFQSAAALERALDVPVLAVIPSFRDEPSPSRDPVSIYRWNGPIAEAYRTLRTGILSRAARSRLVTIAVTSSRVGEGKSTSAVMLGISLASTGRRVILICGDLRRPIADRYLSVTDGPGLTDVLAGRVDSVADVLRETEVPDLLVVPSGSTGLDLDPTELLQSDRMRKVLEDCGSADFVVIDCPAVLAVADALVLAPLADGVLFVASARGTGPQSIEFAKIQLERLGANIVGGILVGLRRPAGLDPSYYLWPESSSRGERARSTPARRGARETAEHVLRPRRGGDRVDSGRPGRPTAVEASVPPAPPVAPPAGKPPRAANPTKEPEAAGTVPSEPKRPPVKRRRPVAAAVPREADGGAAVETGRRDPERVRSDDPRVGRTSTPTSGQELGDGSATDPGSAEPPPRTTRRKKRPDPSAVAAEDIPTSTPPPDAESVP